MFSEMGFDKTEMTEDDIFDLSPLSENELDRYVAIARRSALVETVAKKPAPLCADANDLPGLLNSLHDLIARRQYEDAETLCRSTFWIRPEFKDKYGHPVYLKESLRIALAQNRLDQADLLAGRLAAAVAPTDPCVPLFYARHFDATGRTAEALAKWEEVLAIAPQNGEALKRIPVREKGAGAPPRARARGDRTSAVART
jgi:tetratricopeptide (TPR) repeat protein